MDLIPGRSMLCRAAIAFLFLCSLANAQTPTPTPLDVERSSLSMQSAGVRGVVTDADQAFVANAPIQLATAAGTVKTTSGADGSFSFTGLTAGTFTLTITAPGFAVKLITGTLDVGLTYDVPSIELAAATNVDVQVTLSQHDLAQAQVKAEEKQRIAGFLPNFFVTYDWHAPPLTSHQKFELAWKTTIDPATIVVNGAIAGVQQAQNDFSGYGQGAQGYGKRFGAAVANTVVGNFVGGAILPSILHQDPRYFYMGTGSIRKRAGYALAAAVIARGDNGHWQPNYSSVLGDLSAGALSNLYYPAANRNGAGLTLENGLLGVVGDAVGNVIQEFVFHRITTHVPQRVPPNP
jgi:hypothetical protein